MGIRSIAPSAVVYLLIIWSVIVRTHAAKECVSQPCTNGATCTEVGNAFVCTCFSGFTGVLCADLVKPPDHTVDDQTGVVVGVTVTLLVLLTVVSVAIELKRKKMKHETEQAERRKRIESAAPLPSTGSLSIRVSEAVGSPVANSPVTAAGGYQKVSTTSPPPVSPTATVISPVLTLPTASISKYPIPADAVAAGKDYGLPDGYYLTADGTVIDFDGLPRSSGRAGGGSVKWKDFEAYWREKQRLGSVVTAPNTAVIATTTSIPPPQNRTPSKGPSVPATPPLMPALPPSVTLTQTVTISPAAVPAKSTPPVTFAASPIIITATTTAPVPSTVLNPKVSATPASASLLPSSTVISEAVTPVAAQTSGSSVSPSTTAAAISSTAPAMPALPALPDFPITVAPVVTPATTTTESKVTTVETAPISISTASLNPIPAVSSAAPSDTTASLATTAAVTTEATVSNSAATTVVSSSVVATSASITSDSTTISAVSSIPASSSSTSSPS